MLIYGMKRWNVFNQTTKNHEKKPHFKTLRVDLFLLRMTSNLNKYLYTYLSKAIIYMPYIIINLVFFF